MPEPVAPPRFLVDIARRFVFIGTYTADDTHDRSSLRAACGKVYECAAAAESVCSARLFTFLLYWYSKLRRCARAPMEIGKMCDRTNELFEHWELGGAVISKRSVGII